MKFKIPPHIFETAIPEDRCECLFSRALREKTGKAFVTDCYSRPGFTPYTKLVGAYPIWTIHPTDKAKDLFDRFDSYECPKALLEEFADVEWEIVLW